MYISRYGQIYVIYILSSQVDATEMIFFKIICFVILNLSIGISTQCNNGLPQWFRQLGTKDISSNYIAQSRSVSVPNTESELVSRDKCQSFIPGNCLEAYIDREVIKRSPLPLVLLGNQYYYFGTYFKTNYFKAMQFCHDHGMQLLSIMTREENDLILTYLYNFSKNLVDLWTSGSDLGEEGTFVWLSTGKGLNFTYWGNGQPDNAGNDENCLEIWKFDGKTYAWNDRSCMFDAHFICELKNCSKFCL
ncbi:hypothetical protein HHI36_000002 [Cryptolaemus montrouzieri]|uniref:C-type lectin domain-containing protein n=1 Tax=Cryptolaemus montrouzieri TaxID=559131 RepID=A0ABD2P4F4_9CUCU